MAVSVTNTTCVLNTGVALTQNPATSTVADAAEVFTITPTKADFKLVIIVDNVATDQGAVAISFAEGDFWHATGAVTDSVAQGTAEVFEIEGGKLFQSDGTIALTLTPASGKKLLTDHAVQVSVIQTL